MYEIREAGIEDCHIIRQIAEETWPIAYGHILTDTQLRYMLKLFYSEASLREQMQADKHRFILLTEDGKFEGFASYSQKKNGEPGRYRLHKLYVLPSCQGKGAGRKLIDHLLSDIHQAKGHVLELNVNRQNKARYFYERLGFKVTREEDIDIGNGYWMNDYVMEKSIGDV